MHRTAGPGTAAAAFCGATQSETPSVRPMAGLRTRQTGLVAIPPPTVPGAEAL